MSFQTGWTEMRNWLDKSISDLDEKYKREQSSAERDRLFYKLQGLKMSKQRMEEVSEVFKLCIHDNTIVYGDDTRDVYCTDCGKRFTDWS